MKSITKIHPKSVQKHSKNIICTSVTNIPKKKSRQLTLIRSCEQNIKYIAWPGTGAIK